ncbi:MAG: T9SS type A sorting domain-containing protein [Crocinitomicaceae bacterium]
MKNFAFLIAALLWGFSVNAQITLNTSGFDPCGGCGGYIEFDYSDVNNNSDYTVYWLSDDSNSASVFGSITFTANTGSGIFGTACSGTYYIAAVDVNDDTTGTWVTVLSPPPMTGFVENNTYINGTLDVNVSNGTAPYIYSLNFGPGQASPNFTGLAPGNYNCTVTDANGCMISIQNVIMNYPPPPPPCYLDLFTNPIYATDDTTADGQIGWYFENAELDQAHVIYIEQGGAIDSIVLAPGDTTGTFSNLLTDDYLIWAVNDSACGDSSYVNLGFESYMWTQVLNGCGLCDATVHFGIEEFVSNPPYNFKFYDVSSTPVLLGDYNNVLPDWIVVDYCLGEYLFLIIDGSGDTVSQQLTLDYEQVSCTHENTTMIDGKITCYPTGGNNSNYTFSLNGSNWQSNNVFSGLPGSLDYEVYVKDGAGCEDTSVALAIDPSTTDCILEIETTAYFETCYDSCDGAIEWVIVNAHADSTYLLEITGPGGYSMTTTLSPGDTTGIIENLCNGSYSFTVSLNSQCSLNHVEKVEGAAAPLEPYLYYVTPPTIGNADGHFEVGGIGGVGPYQYSYTGGATWQNSGVFSGSAGGYCLIHIKDANGCITSIVVYLGWASSENEEQALFEIYPNPATTEFTINTNESISYQLFDLNGKIVKQGVYNGNGFVDVSQLRKGVYLLELNADNNYQRMKLVVQ